MEWIEIEELPGYEINGLGDVKNIKSGLIYKYCLSCGYLLTRVRINRKQRTIKQHQIIMRYHNEEYRLFQGFKYVIDHIDSNKLNNNIDNLRVISNRENCSKEKTIKKGLPVGVYKYKNGKYVSYITINKKQKNLGYYTTPLEASNAYKKELERHESVCLL